MPGGSAQGARIRCWAVFGGCRTLDPPLAAPGLLLPLHQVDHGGDSLKAKVVSVRRRGNLIMYKIFLSQTICPVRLILLINLMRCILYQNKHG